MLVCKVKFTDVIIFGKNREKLDTKLIVKLTVILPCSPSSFPAFAATTEGLVTTEDKTARVEEAAEEIDDNQDNEDDSNHYASDSACSKLSSTSLGVN